MAEAGQATKDAFKTWRLVEAGNAVVLQPAIVGVPCLRLILDFVAHDGFRSEEAEKAELGEAAEKETGIGRKPGKPCGSASVMNVPLVGEGDPNVDIREKK